MKTKTAILCFSVAVFALCMAIVPARAENIDPLDDGSQYGYSENTGWLNAEPQGNGGPGVTVYDDRVEGYIWGENIGWINLSPENYGGVINNGDGGLSGYAWGENVGWINFAPATGGVFIDKFTGRFSGWAWGENIGWINFNLTTQAGYAARTSWSVWGDDWNSDPDNDGLVNLDDPDADGDGLSNILEASGCTSFDDADTDDDGLTDGTEDANHDGIVDSGETNPCNIDRDGDGIQDGTEQGVTLADIGLDTDIDIFQPDLDPLTTTNALLPDTDGDGFDDGVEDANLNGRVDAGESDPNNENSRPIQKGDVNGDGFVDLSDAVMALQICAAIDQAHPVHKAADVNVDNKIGIEETIYILEIITGLRE